MRDAPGGGTTIAALTEVGPPPFVAVGEEPVVVGRSAESSLCLADPTVSRRHATVRRDAGRLVVEDHDGRFGTFVNGARVRSVALRDGDRVRFGSKIAYRVHGDGLRLDLAAEGMALDVIGLGLDGDRGDDPGRLLGRLRRRVPSEAGPRALVRDVGFRVRPDAFVGLLGPSGAGKSTILAALAGRRVPDLGRIIADGRDDPRDDPDAYRAMLGHVPQDDVVFLALTARENLAYAARLRLGPDVGVAAIDAAVLGALDRVDLAGHADKPAAVLSGGQRKRLSVAVELLRRPRLLLLDEPTSGLDPAGEARLMEGLRSLSRRGTTVVCTTHTMDNLRLLDEVVALGVVDGVGRLAYAGPPDGLLAHFGRRHVADVYEDLASGRFDPVVAPDEAPGLAAAMARGEGRTPTGTGPASGPATDATGPPGDGLGQLAVVARRAALLASRDRGLVAMMVGQPVVLGTLVGLTQYDIGLDGVPRVLSFAVVIAVWLGLNHSARDLVRERKHYLRDRLAGLRPGAYLGAKAATHGAAGVAQVLLLLAALRVACGLAVARDVLPALRETPWAWAAAVLWLCHLGGVGLGLLASTLARTEEAAVAALPLLILPQLLIGAVAVGVQDESYSRARPFRPLVVTLAGRERLSRPAALVDAASMACLSRPAALLVDPRKAAGFGRWAWAGDLCHLLILALATWAAVVLAFARAESRWLRSTGT